MEGEREVLRAGEGFGCWIGGLEGFRAGQVLALACWGECPT